MVWYDRNAHNSSSSGKRKSFRRDEFFMATMVPQSSASTGEHDTAMERVFASGLEGNFSVTATAAPRQEQPLPTSAIFNCPARVSRMSVLLMALHLDDCDVDGCNFGTSDRQPGRPPQQQPPRQRQTSRTGSLFSSSGLFDDDGSSVGSGATLVTCNSAVSCLFRQTQPLAHDDTESSSSSISDHSDLFRTEQVAI
jgi:hypothetical protein